MFSRKYTFSVLFDKLTKEHVGQMSIAPPFHWGFLGTWKEHSILITSDNNNTIVARTDGCLYRWFRSEIRRSV